MTIAFKLDDDGGFYAVDHARKIGCYAYPTSDSATAAKRDPEGVARRMIDSDAKFLAGCPSAVSVAATRYDRYAAFIATADDDLELTELPEEVEGSLEQAVRQTLPLVADSWSTLRGCDIYRLMGEFASLDWPLVADMIKSERPDLAADTDEALADIQAGV